MRGSGCSKRVFVHHCPVTQASPGGSAVKNHLETQELQETWVQSLGREDPLEEGMATHSSVLAWKPLWTRRAWWAAVLRATKSWTQLK